MFHKCCLQSLFYIGVKRKFAFGADDLIRTFAAKQICDQYSVFAINESVKGQTVFLFVFCDIDRASASGAPVAVVHPAGAYRAAKLHLSLAKRHLQKLGELLIYFS